MGLSHMHLLQAHFFLAVLCFFASKSVSTQTNFPIAKPKCRDRCGNVTIPFPFGTREGCYFSETFSVTCNDTHYQYPPKLFLGGSNINITTISLEGQFTVLAYITEDCYAQDGTRVQNNEPSIALADQFTVNSTANKFTAVGCDTYGFVSGGRINQDDFTTGCTSMCASEDDLVDGPCSGVGCCQMSIPKGAWGVGLTLYSYHNFTKSYDNNSSTVWDFDNCSYAFLAETSAFNFSRNSLSTLKSVTELPMVVDWAIGNGTCKEAKKNKSSYACISSNSKCYEPDNGYGHGYRCYCRSGYQGNPYLLDGCQDVDECQDPNLNNCEKERCKNTPGNFTCFCPKGFRGDGRKDGRGCIRRESHKFIIVAVVALVVIFLLLVAISLYSELKRRNLIRLKRKFFLQNGGLLLQEQLNRKKSPDTAKIFTSAELKKATNDFHDSRIIGKGGFGTVYKGFLSDNRIVAVKKSKQVDPNQVEQFINEVIVLCQVNHRNVVRLLGCCLEVKVPLLVYEFIDNGTLFEHIHNKIKARALSWDRRLRVATETAEVLMYLHSAASPPIIHRDVKSANILLDTSFTAKVSDFGASRLVPLDQTQLNTLVQGTYGYLDPEYMQTSQLTEKSDVYSFGVVLVELLTGKKALSNDRPEEDRNLACYFLSTLRKGCLFQILDDSIACEENSEQLISVAMLAEKCLNMKGEDRPSMKIVTMELERLRLSGKHSLVQTESDVQDKESPFLSRPMNVDASGEGSSTSTTYDSLRDHVMLPIDGGR